MERVLDILNQRQGLFASASMPDVKREAAEVVASECCDTNCGECDC